MQAVTALIQRGDRFLAVARRGTTDQWGLPGGKVEPGERMQDAILRELLEETGIQLSHSDLLPLYSGKDDCGYSVFTFMAKTDQEPIQGDAGPVKFASVEEFLDGPFSTYNRNLFKSAGVLNDPSKLIYPSEDEAYSHYDSGADTLYISSKNNETVNSIADDNWTIIYNYNAHIVKVREMVGVIIMHAQSMIDDWHNNPCRKNIALRILDKIDEWVSYHKDDIMEEIRNTERINMEYISGPRNEEEEVIWKEVELKADI